MSSVYSPVADQCREDFAGRPFIPGRQGAIRRRRHGRRRSRLASYARKSPGIDLSPSDAWALPEARFARAGLTAEFICADVFDHHPAEGYDAVALNFFLNFFPAGPMRNALGQLVELVKPGGKLFIADYAYPRGNWLLRLPQVIYWRITNVFFWAVSFGGLGALHPIYDYVAVISWSSNL